MFNAPWIGRSRAMSLTLKRLGEREAAAIIEPLFGNKELPPDAMAEIVECTDGITLFVKKSSAGFTHDDATQIKLDKLDTLSALTSSKQDARFLPRCRPYRTTDPIPRLI